MRYLQHFICLALLLFASTAVIAAQDEAPAANESAAEPEAAPETESDATPESDPSAEQPAEEESAKELRAKFDEVSAELKKLYAQIEQIKLSYQTADASERAGIEEKFLEAEKKAQALVDQMTVAALAAYKSSPEDNKDLVSLLMEVARFRAAGEPAGEPGKAGGNVFGADQFEEALEVVKVLVAGGVEDPLLFVWGGVSAVCTNDFDLAKEYLDKANELGAFAEPPPREEFMHPNDGILWMAIEYYHGLDSLRADWEKEKAIREAEAEADDLPRVKIVTTRGEIEVELYENEAPQATANFLSLCKEGYYDGIPFHRVLPRFMAQGGDNKQGGPGYTIRCECFGDDYRKHFRGVLSMAKPSVPPRDSASAQFFMCFVPTRSLDGNYTAFGRVVKGMEVIGKIQKIDPSPKVSGQRPKPDAILKTEVLRDRGHEYNFEKITR